MADRAGKTWILGRTLACTKPPASNAVSDGLWRLRAPTRGASDQHVRFVASALPVAMNSTHGSVRRRILRGTRPAAATRHEAGMYGPSDGARPSPTRTKARTRTYPAYVRTVHDNGAPTYGGQPQRARHGAHALRGSGHIGAPATSVDPFAGMVITGRSAAWSPGKSGRSYSQQAADEGGASPFRVRSAIDTIRCCARASRVERGLHILANASWTAGDCCCVVPGRRARWVWQSRPQAVTVARLAPQLRVAAASRDGCRALR